MISFLRLEQRTMNRELEGFERAMDSFSKEEIEEYFAPDVIAMGYAKSDARDRLYEFIERRRIHGG